MRFFTREWMTGELDDDEFEAVPGRYREHLARLEPSGAVARLAREVDLHDALVEEALVDRARRQLHLTFVTGDLQVGYRSVSVTYSEVEISEHLLCTLRAVTSRARSEVCWQEVDKGGEGRWVQRLIFWPEGECAISFRTVDVTQSPRATRNLTSAEEGRYLEVPPGPPAGSI